jgi:hypothetical protein
MLGELAKVLGHLSACGRFQRHPSVMYAICIYVDNHEIAAVLLTCKSINHQSINQ